jgi:hypothetical protein
MTPHKLSINSHRTRNLLTAVLIGDVRNSPFRQHRWLLQGLLRQQAPTRLDSCCRERKNDQQHRARLATGHHTGGGVGAASQLVLVVLGVVINP